MRYCIHASCNQKTYSATDSLCKYHRDEMQMSGAGKHYNLICSWCEEHKDLKVKEVNKNE